MDIATAEPALLQAGDTLRWRITLPDYPASDGWALAYRLINATATITIAAVADGDVHAVEIQAATSAAYPPGQYTGNRTITRGSDRFTLAPWTVRVLPDLATAIATDARGPAQRALDDLRAALLKWLSTNGHVQEYEIAGRKMRFASINEINKRIALAQREAAAEAAAAGLATNAARRRVLVRFG